MESFSEDATEYRNAQKTTQKFHLSDDIRGIRIFSKKVVQKNRTVVGPWTGRYIAK